MVFHGATGPSRAEAARLARQEPPPADTALAERMNALLGSLLRGTAEDPVEACRRYEEVGRRLAESRGEQARWRGTTCDASPEAVRYYYRYTARSRPAPSRATGSRPCPVDAFWWCGPFLKGEWPAEAHGPE